MNKEYRVLDACNTNLSYAFETIESKMNRVAKKGFRLDQPLQIFAEDRGDNAPRMYCVIIIMSKKEKEKKPKKQKKPKIEKKPEQTEVLEPEDASEETG